MQLCVQNDICYVQHNAYGISSFTCSPPNVVFYKKNDEKKYTFQLFHLCGISESKNTYAIRESIAAYIYGIINFPHSLNLLTANKHINVHKKKQYIPHMKKSKKK